jgi:hypothetical protein
MNASAQRIAIAKHLDWTEVHWYEDNAGPPILSGKPPFDVGMDDKGEWTAERPKYRVTVPEFLESRDAMAMAVSSLPPFYKAQFGAQLGLLVAERYLGKFDELHQALQLAEIATASAPMMAEAFLKAVNEWKP